MDRKISHLIRIMIEQLLPHFVVAGKTAMRIQDLLKSVPQEVEQKTGSRFASALTDADGALQTYLATVLLALFPDVRFEGEETDPVSKYFPARAPIAVTLDPVNGTLFFKDGLPIFDIIMTFRYEGQLAGAIVYLPRFEKFYIGIGGLGAFTTTPERLKRETFALERFQLPVGEPIIFTYGADPELRAMLAVVGIRVVDLKEDYRPDAAWPFTCSAIFEGKIGAIVKRDCNLIDWGAVSFVARLAGGIETERTGFYLPEYDPKKLRTPWMVVAQSRELHERIIAAINQ